MPLTSPSYFLATAPNRLIGADSGYQQTGNSVFFAQNGAGNQNTGSDIVALGVNAARSNAASDLIIIGNNNPQSLTVTANGSVLIGHRILAAVTPSLINSTVAIGADVMGNMIPTVGIGESVVIGTRAMQGGTTGATGGSTPDRMVIIGFEAGRFVRRDGNGMDENTFVGYQAGRGLNAATSFAPNNCTYVGALCGLQHAGSNNTAVGNDAFSGNGSGVRNVAIGQGAMNGSTTGNDNVGIGSTVSTASSGSSNVVIGGGAGIGGGSDRNVALGASAGPASGTSGNAIYLGYSAGSTAAGAQNQFVVEAAESTGQGRLPYLFGDLANGNLTLGNLITAGNPTGRTFGTGAVNNFKLQLGTVPSTAPTNGVSLVATNDAGVINLRVIGPTGVSQIIATGL